MNTSSAVTYSTRELRAAAAALAAGQFASPTQPRRPASRTLADHAVTPFPNATGGPQAGSDRDHRRSEPLTRSGAEIAAGHGYLVRVWAANAGAGSSTLALALADVADLAGIRTRVLDAAAPAWSGLSGATATELGSAEGWRRGRRGAHVLIDRVEAPIRTPADIPRAGFVVGVDLTVLDTGWSRRELVACDCESWVVTAAAHAEVLVTRPHGLALSQTEAALADLSDHVAADRVVVVVVGASGWREREFASAGDLLRTSHDKGAVVFAPLLPAKALPSLGPGRLPKQLTGPAQRLLARVTNITGPLPHGGPERT